MGLKNFDYYSKNPLAYPNKEDFGRVFVYHKGKVIVNGVKREDIPDIDMVKYRSAGYTVENEFDKEGYRKAQRAYRAETSRLEEEFKTDLFDEHGVTDHPKAQKVFALAWEHGHSAGYSEIAIYFDDFVELIK